MRLRRALPAHRGVLVIIVAAASANLRVPSGQPLRFGIAAGLLDTFGNVWMLLALRASLLSLDGVLIALYPAAMVVWRWWCSAKRVTRPQLVGIRSPPSPRVRWHWVPISRHRRGA